ncbi:MAG: glycosyltransferase family 2 protein [Bacteroidota bacterium]
MKANQPFVSVIIAFYNEENFLTEAIDSVLAQTYTNWELLLVDDGSDQKTTSIALQYAEAFPQRIFYLKHEGHQNKGASASRNLGIEKAVGAYIALLDADDVWLPAKLQSQVAIAIENTDAAMICEASEYWHSWSNDGKKDNIVLVGQKLSGMFYPPQLLETLYPLGSGAAPCPSSLLVKKETVGAIGGFDETFHGIYQLYEDQVFLTKIYLHSPVFISTACNNKYRQRLNSCVSTVHESGKYHEVRKYFLHYFQNYIAANHLGTPLTSRLLHKALLPYGNGLKNGLERLVNKASRFVSKI